MMINLWAAWLGMLMGCVAGATAGLFFHDEEWMGGYASWRRRMIRLAHIAFFGIGLINLGFALTARSLKIETGLTLPSVFLIIGAVGMPFVCYLSAFKKEFRHLFFIPAGSVSLAIALFLWRIMK